MRRRPAPNAVRTAISRRRVVEAARVKFATLRHAINSTSATAPNMSNGTVPAPFVMKACRGSRVARSSGMNMFGNCCRRSASGLVSASSADAVVVPGLNRPRQSRPPFNGLVLVNGTRIGSHRSASDAPVSGNSKSFGRTPTIVCGRPSIWIDVPSTPGSAWKRRRHRRSLTITTSAPSGRASSGRKFRPSAG